MIAGPGSGGAGGLKMIASGEASRSQTIQMPSVALFVILINSQSSAVVPPANIGVKVNNNLTGRLSTDGLSLTLSGVDLSGNWYAFG